MNSRKFIITCVLTTAAFFINSCYWNYEPPDNSKYFSSELEGTWKTNDPDSIYSGELVITNNSITITGYGEKQKPADGDDSQRPFRDFIKGTALKSYSVKDTTSSEYQEKGYIYIEEAGILHEGIPYTYWYEISPSDKNRIHFLRLDFGGRKETLQKVNVPDEIELSDD